MKVAITKIGYDEYMTSLGNVSSILQSLTPVNNEYTSGSYKYYIEDKKIEVTVMEEHDIFASKEALETHEKEEEAKIPEKPKPSLAAEGTEPDNEIPF